MHGHWARERELTSLPNKTVNMIFRKRRKKNREPIPPYHWYLSILSCKSLRMVFSTSCSMFLVRQLYEASSIDSWSCTLVVIVFSLWNCIQFSHFMLDICYCLVCIFLSFLRMIGKWSVPLRSYFLLYLISGAIDRLAIVRSIIDLQPSYAL